MKRSGPLKRTAPMPRGRAPRARNPKRKASEFQRIYGSAERIEFVNSLPCSVQPAHGGRIENAHSVTGGMGRKADASTVLPLCHLHHMMLHVMGVKSFEAKYNVSLADCAARTAAAWDAIQEAA